MIIYVRSTQSGRQWVKFTAESEHDAIVQYFQRDPTTPATLQVGFDGATAAATFDVACVLNVTLRTKAAPCPPVPAHRRSCDVLARCC